MVGHYMDHWSKFHVLFALCQKSAAGVAQNLQNQVLSYLGTPKILHSDNGREFPSDDQLPSESDDQPPSVSDTQHLSKSRAQDVSESDVQLQITVEKKV